MRPVRKSLAKKLNVASYRCNPGNGGSAVLTEGGGEDHRASSEESRLSPKQSPKSGEKDSEAAAGRQDVSNSGTKRGMLAIGGGLGFQVRYIGFCYANPLDAGRPSRAGIDI